MRSRRLLKGIADTLRSASRGQEGAGSSLPPGIASHACQAGMAGTSSTPGAYCWASSRPFSTGTHPALQRFRSSQGDVTTLRSSRPGILRSIAFCSAVSAAAFTTAALLEDDSYRHAWDRLRRHSVFRRQPGSDLPGWLQGSPRFLQNLYREFWLERTPQERVLGSLLAANGLVYLLLRRFPNPNGTVFRTLVQQLPPQPLRTLTLLTSNFSHLSGMHLAFNMLALWSFGREAAGLLGGEQFLAFYLSAGLASALASQLGRRRSGGGGYSLGASGAVYACFALTAMTRPDAEVVLIFLPFLPIRIGDALSVAMALDLAGALLGWRRLDHWGHLGGALFGLYYVLRGQHELWPRFQQVAAKLRARWEGEGR